MHSRRPQHGIILLAFAERFKVQGFWRSVWVLAFVLGTQTHFCASRCLREHPDVTFVTSGYLREDPDVTFVTSGSLREHPDVTFVTSGCFLVPPPLFGGVFGVSCIVAFFQVVALIVFQGLG